MAPATLSMSTQTAIDCSARVTRRAVCIQTNIDRVTQASGLSSKSHYSQLRTVQTNLQYPARCQVADGLSTVSPDGEGVIPALSVNAGGALCRRSVPKAASEWDGQVHRRGERIQRSPSLPIAVGTPFRAAKAAWHSVNT